MIYGQSVLRGALAPSNNYFGYRSLMMSGFGAADDCASASADQASCLACCQGKPNKVKCKNACKAKNWGSGGGGTDQCNYYCTSPCATGNPADCCHYQCPSGVNPPLPPAPSVIYTPGSGVVDTTTGDTLTSADATTTNWLLIGGLGLGAFLIGKYMFGGKAA